MRTTHYDMVITTIDQEIKPSSDNNTMCIPGYNNKFVHILISTYICMRIAYAKTPIYTLKVFKHGKTSRGNPVIIGGNIPIHQQQVSPDVSSDPVGQ